MSDRDPRPPGIDPRVRTLVLVLVALAVVLSAIGMLVGGPDGG